MGSPPTTRPPIVTKPSPPATTKPATAYSFSKLSDAGQGEKFLIHAQSGRGKSTLGTHFPEARFVVFDDGARKVVNPITGEAIEGLYISSWSDLRGVTQAAPDIIPPGGTLVVDTVTEVPPFLEQWVCENVKTEKGAIAKTINHYGYGEGYKHMYDEYRCWLTDLDNVIRSGRNVVLLAQLEQTIVPNPGGADFYQEVPRLFENKKAPMRSRTCEWADHVIYIGLLDAEIIQGDVNAKAGKISGSNTRALFTGGAPHYIAKSRLIKRERAKAIKLPPIISFNDESDDSLIQYVFNGAEIPNQGE